MIAKVAGSNEFKVGTGDKTWSELLSLEGVLGGNLLYNSEEWITESGTWTAPVTGWYDVLLIGGGQGAFAHRSWHAYVAGGNSGRYKTTLTHLTAGQQVDAVIGAGGIGGKSASESNTIPAGNTSFGSLTSASGLWLPGRVVGSDSSTDGVWVHGSGFGAAYSASNISNLFYGAGGGGSTTGADKTGLNGIIVQNGGPGAIRLRYYDSNK